MKVSIYKSATNMAIPEGEKLKTVETEILPIKGDVIKIDKGIFVVEGRGFVMDFPNPVEAYLIVI